MSPIVKTLVQLMDTERRQIKICAVEDCMKAKRLLAGWGLNDHLGVLSNPAEWFDYFYSLEIEDLHKELDILTATGSEYAQRIHNLGFIGKHD
jgi:hypothetical protein